MYFYYLASVVTLILAKVSGQKYILTSKNAMSNYVAKEHDLDLLASFEDVTFYTTVHDNLMKYNATFSEFYEIEEDVKITLNFENLLTSDNEDRSLKYSVNLVTLNESVPWHLDRIVNRDLPTTETFSYEKCLMNKNVDIHTYVIDTGIDVNHPEFEGRATWLANFADTDDTDCQSHGTHCAGIIGSKTYGVCKDAKLFAVKVLDCEGSGSMSSVIAGIEYAYKRHVDEDAKSGGNVRSIISMSLGGGLSFALNKAVKATLNDDHFYFAAAAGNENTNACRSSPASVKEIFTVMASDKDDNKARFSNWGNCADIYSPGVNIISTIPDGETATYSGTSMACPNLVGVLNHYLDQYPEMNMKKLKEKVLSDSSKNKIVGNPKGTNDYLVFLNRSN